MYLTLTVDKLRVHYNLKHGPRLFMLKNALTTDLLIAYKLEHSFCVLHTLSFSIQSHPRREPIESVGLISV